MKAAKICLAMVSLFFISCYNSAFDETLFRTTSDPSDDTPKTDSVSRLGEVLLAWKDDPAADKFYLMRSFDVAPPDWSCIYEGVGTEWSDKSISAGGKYIYRLDKTRGKKYFEGKEYVFKTVIPRNIRLAEAPSYGKPCIVYDPESKGAIAYFKLAKELLERDGKGK